MVFNLEHKLQSSDILFPKIYEIGELGLTAVFRSPEECTVVLYDEYESETKTILAENEDSIPIIELVGTHTDLFSVDTKVNGIYSWKACILQDLIWNIDNRIVGWQLGDEVTIVDSISTKCSLLANTEDVAERDWVSAEDFILSIKTSVKMLVPPITKDEAIIFRHYSEVEEYHFMTTGEKSIASENSLSKLKLPIIQTIHGVFSTVDTDEIIRVRDYLSNLTSFQKWKELRE